MFIRVVTISKKLRIEIVMAMQMLLMRMIIVMISPSVIWLLVNISAVVTSFVMATVVAIRLLIVVLPIGFLGQV